MYFGKLHPGGGALEAAALPVAGNVEFNAGDSPRSKRSRQQLERSQESALAALAAISSCPDVDGDLPDFFTRLSATVAELTNGRRAAFWRLGSRGTLGLQPEPFGFDDHSRIYDV